MDFVRDNWKLAASLTAAAASGALAGVVISDLKSKAGLVNQVNLNTVPQKWVRVGAVSEIILYPVKSCKGINVHEATCTKIGLKGYLIFSSKKKLHT